MHPGGELGAAAAGVAVELGVDGRQGGARLVEAVEAAGPADSDEQLAGGVVGLPALRAEGGGAAEELIAAAQRVAGLWSVLSRDERGDATAALRLDAEDELVCKVQREASGAWSVTVSPPNPRPGEPPVPDEVRLRAANHRAALHLADAAAEGFGWRLQQPKRRAPAHPKPTPTGA